MWASGVFARHVVLLSLVFLLLVFWAIATAKAIPQAFIPHEDQGTVMVDANLPEGCVRSLTAEACGEAVTRMRGVPGVESVLLTAGMSRIGGRGENQAMMTVRLKPWDERPGQDLEVQSVRTRINETNSTLPM